MFKTKSMKSSKCSSIKITCSLLYFLFFFTITSCKDNNKSIIEPPEIFVEPNPMTWAKRTDLPTLIGRHHPVTFSINGFGYVGLGSNNVENFSDFFQYDPKMNAWKKLKDFAGGRRTLSYGVSYNDRAYTGFGENGAQVFKDFWEYNSSSDSWTELKSCNCEGRTHPAMVRIKDKIYIGMGTNVSDKNLNDWWEYDITKNTWLQKASLPSLPRHHPFYFAVNDKAYVGFGHGSVKLNDKIIYKDFYQYSPETDSWKQLKDFPESGRVAGTQFDYNGFGYILSGQGETHQNFTTGEFWKYNPTNDSWSVLPPPQGSSRWAPGSFMIDKKLYFVGGQSNTAYEKDLSVFLFE
jgi:N-acetylneuraminic acid mutarotase